MFDKWLLIPPCQYILLKLVKKKTNIVVSYVASLACQLMLIIFPILFHFCAKVVLMIAYQKFNLWKLTNSQLKKQNQGGNIRPGSSQVRKDYNNKMEKSSRGLSMFV